MRIRRKPLTLPSLPDPFPTHPPSGRLDDSKERVLRVTGGGGGGGEEGEGLHPNGDLPKCPLGLGNATSKIALQDPPLLAPTHLEVIMEEEEVDQMVDSSSTQVNSNKRKGNKGRDRGSSSLEMDGYTDGGDANERKTCTMDDALVVKDVKKRRSPAVLMEGSRCSRVNGRGWRCCQQTLVGYSLCEHHLGKGRLRSMSSVRGQLGTTKREASKKPQSSAGDIEKEELDEEEKDAKKTGKKIGIVKARSINSLLGEDDKFFSSEGVA